MKRVSEELIVSLSEFDSLGDLELEDDSILDEALAPVPSRLPPAAARPTAVSQAHTGLPDLLLFLVFGLRSDVQLDARVLLWVI